jgi:hypothetical protein
VMALDFREKRGVLGRVVSVDTGVLGETCRVEWTDGTRGTYAATDLAVPTDLAVFGGGKGKESPRPFPQVRARPPACVALRRVARAARRAPGRARPRRCRRARCSARRLGSADAERGVPRRSAEGMRLVRGEGRDISSYYGGRDVTCPVSTGGRGGCARPAPH